MDLLHFHLNQMLAVDRPTVLLLVVIALVCLVTIKNHLVIPALAYLLAPLVVGVGLIANYAFALGEVFEISRIDQWVLQVIVSGTIGAVFSVGLAAVIGRAIEAQRSRLARSL